MQWGPRRDNGGRRIVWAPKACTEQGGPAASPLPTADDQRFLVENSVDRQASAGPGLPWFLCVPNDKNRESGHDFLSNLDGLYAMRDNSI